MNHRGAESSTAQGFRNSENRAVIELLRSNDAVKISWLIAALKGEGIEAFVFDRHMSVVEGSAIAIPRRLMVAEEDGPRARRLLREMGELDGAP